MEATPVAATAAEFLYHRIGGGEVENLRLKPTEAKLKPPGFSVLMAATAAEAAAQMRAAYPKQARLIAATGTIGSTTAELISGAGFDLLSVPSKAFPNNHFRVIHPEGLAGFTDENLLRLSTVFTNTTGL
jgi:hypothetical protein